MAYASAASTTTTGGTTETIDTWININAASPLFTYEPVDGWSQDAQGGSTCSGMEGVTYAVGLNGTYCTCGLCRCSGYFTWADVIQLLKSHSCGALAQNTQSRSVLMVNYNPVQLPQVVSL
jgi:hypothetical protein